MNSLVSCIFSSFSWVLEMPAQWECPREQAEVNEHPPAPGSHVQEELHECQQVVVVI